MKNAQREAALSLRRAMSVEERERAGADISDKLLALPELRIAKTVLSYLAAWDEVDLSYANRALSARGCVVAYPVCVEKGHMEAYVPDSPDALITGAYGIKSPDPSRARLLDAMDIEAILLPCVAFDESLNRLGHGAGYYDRFILRCPDAFRICAAFESQRLERVFTEEHDIKMNVIITELAELR